MIQYCGLAEVGCGRIQVKLTTQILIDNQISVKLYWP